ncbi:hypothetical protein SETIT_7G062200v2 [Setaria italica]|uniref:Uncharacterized protein n=2 Tax=Setaria TaxID=4554 RepID=A0A368RSM2_SETIT|nr:hypothetical protein SETIT_7G062200v2 [Setaria italica]TKW03812.1 hypothetical protein SEVIR_7G068600v2 [Setaria viridis]
MHINIPPAPRAENREAFICACEADQESALIWLRNEMAYQVLKEQQ